MEVWRRTVRSWFPDLYSRTHCVPPVYFVRVVYGKATIGGQTALLTQKPHNTDASGNHDARSFTDRPGSSGQSAQTGCSAPAGQSVSSSSTTSSQTAGRSQEDPCLAASSHHTSKLDDSAPSVKPKPPSKTGSAFSKSSFHSGPSADYGRRSKAVKTSQDKSQTNKTTSRHGSQTDRTSRGKSQADKTPKQGSQVDNTSQDTASVEPASRGQPAPYSMWTRETQTQTRPVQIFESDTRDDFAQQHVLHCLQELGQRRQEVMFVLSQLNFSDYLNKPAYSAAAAQLPLPADLPKDHRRGDFDIVLIHRHHGILIGEIKAIGLKDAELNKQESEADAVVAKRVERSIKQLDKSEKMVKHLVQDIAAGVSVKKTLILPYVTNAQLQRVLSTNPPLEQALSQCLGVPVGTSPLQMCLCAEQLSHRATAWYLSSTSLCELEAWWQGRMACDNDSVMSDDVYLNLIARFCGPATTVSVHCVVTPRLEVRTLWEAVSEVGERIARLVLTPEQQDLLHRLPDLVCLSGPPGTGKSVGLVLVGLQWLRQGVDVHVVSTNHASLAASLLIFHQLKLTLRSDAVAASLKVTVVFHDFDFLNDENGVELAVNDLVAAARGQRLCVLMDESTFTDGRMATLYQTFVDGLYARVSRLSLWAGAVRHANIPARLQVEPLTVPLRSAPAIVREIERGTVRAQGHVHDYSSSGTPSPCDGPSVIRLRHEGVGHVGSWPVECFQCGQDVGGALRQLHVGVTDDSTHSNAPQAKKAKTSQEARPPPLQYRDVVVLTRSSGLHDDVKDKDGHVTVPASGVVLGLRSAGIPVHVIRTDDSKQWRQDVADIAVARTDQVTVSWYGAVFGLERKIVVCLPGRWRGVDHQRSAESVDALDRIFAVSRCTAQLIFVDVPRDNAGDNPHVPRGNVYDHPVPRENANDYAVPKGNTDAPPVPKVNADDHPVPRENADTPPVPKVNDDDRPVPRENAEDRPVPKDSESLAHDKKDIANVKDDAGSLGTMSRDSKNERGVLNSVMCTKHADLWPVLFKLSEL